MPKIVSPEIHLHWMLQKPRLDYQTYMLDMQKQKLWQLKLGLKYHTSSSKCFFPIITAKATDTPTIQRGISTGIIIGINNPVPNNLHLLDAPPYSKEIRLTNNNVGNSNHRNNFTRSVNYCIKYK